MVVLGERFASAVAWASALHADQVRKATNIPYVAHVISVAALVLEDEGSEDEAIAALLHDAVEDGHATLDEIGGRYGPTVAGIVAACTDTIEGSERGPGDWRERKEQYLEHLRAPSVTDGALRVSSADKLHNARSILADLRRLGPSLWDRFNTGVDDQLWYYRGLVDAFEARRPDSPLTTELARTVANIEASV
jgi:(p)ppGpp synthase/HD superfamily hydrolase